MVMDRPPFVLELTTKNFVRVVAFALSLFFFWRAPSVLVRSYRPFPFSLSFRWFLSVFTCKRIFKVTLMFNGICEVVAEMQ